MPRPKKSSTRGQNRKSRSTGSNGNGHAGNGHMRHTEGRDREERNYSVSNERQYQGRQGRNERHYDDDEGYGGGRRNMQRSEAEDRPMYESRDRREGRYDPRDGDYGVTAGRRSNAWYGNPDDREAWSRERGDWGDHQHERYGRGDQHHRDEYQDDRRSMRGRERDERGGRQGGEWYPDDQSYYGSREAGRRMNRADEDEDDYRGGYSGRHERYEENERGSYGSRRQGGHHGRR